MLKEEERMQINLEMVGDIMRALKIDKITVNYDGPSKCTISCTNTDLRYLLAKTKAQIYYKFGLETTYLYNIVIDLLRDAVKQAGYGYIDYDGSGGTFTIYSNNTSILEHYYKDIITQHREIIGYRHNENEEVTEKLIDITKKILSRWRDSALNIEFINHSGKLTFYGKNGYYRYKEHKEEKLEFKELASIISRHFDMVRKNLEFDPEHIIISIEPENKNTWNINAYGYNIKKNMMKPVKFGKPFEIESPRMKTKPNKIKP